jgi:RND family efflux transporter MFP subunit
MIREVRVLRGQKVKAGDVLAVLDSPDVGTARLDLRGKQLELSLARTEAEWATTVATNVRELIDALAKDVSAKQIEKLFADRPLGARRGELLVSYADLEITRHEEERQTDFLKRGLVGEHPAFKAMHEREAAQAKFQANLEQVRFDAQQAKRRADQAVMRAEAAVLDASQRLRVLGAEASIRSSSAEDDDVTAFPIVAPFDGTITARSAVPSQRVDTTDVLFTLADLDTVRVTANVDEFHMGALAGLKVGDPLRIRTTAYPDVDFEGKTIYVGTEVDPRTRAVTLLAELPNPEGRLRPGMFAKVLLEGVEAETALTVPAGAVTELEGRPIVFVPAGEPNQFVARHVEVGREAGGRRVVLSGLKAGDTVVATNAFTLKSELILQNMPDED